MRWGPGHWGRDRWGGEIAPRKLTYALEIDWNNDGLFDGTNEARYMEFWSSKRGRRQVLKSDNTGFEPIMVGDLEIHLQDDEDRRFDAYNQFGPLYGMLNNGVALRFRVADEATGIPYYAFEGEVIDLRPISGKTHKVTLRAADGVKKLNTTVTTGLQTNITISDAIIMILDTIGWTQPMSIDGTTDVLPYWWATGKSALAEIMDLTDASLGTFYVSADGTAVYKSRNNSTLTSISLIDTDFLEDFGFQVPTPQDVIRNSITVNVRPRTIQTAVELWRLQDAPSIDAGETKEDIWAPYTYNGQATPALNILCDPTTDFLVNTAANGSGTDITGLCTITKYDFANTSKLAVYNGSGLFGYIILLKLRGDAVTAPANPTQIIKQNAASIAQLNAQYDFVLDTNWLQETNWAISLATYLMTLLSVSGRYFPQVKLKDNPAKQFGVELFDRITLNSVRENVNAILRVGYIEHTSVNKHCDVVETVIYHEPNIGVSTTNQWFFTAYFGVSTNFTL